MPAMQFVECAENGFDGVVVDGVLRKLNLTPPKAKAIPRLRDATDLIPESQWRSTTRLADIGDLCPRYNQGQVGSCEPNSEVEAMGGLRAIAGLPSVRLSSAFLYALINGGADNGASIGDGFPMLQQFGVCTEKSCPEGFYVRGQLTQAQFAEARNYRALVAYHCPTFEEIVTAHLKGCWVVNGVVVGRRFDSLDSDGCYPPTRGAPNHAVSMWDLRQRSNGEWFLWQLNHWGTDWGVNGDFGTSQAAYEAEGYQDSIAYQVVSFDAGTLPPPARAA